MQGEKTRNNILEHPLYDVSKHVKNQCLSAFAMKKLVPRPAVLSTFEMSEDH